MCAWSTLYTFIPISLWFCTFSTVSMSIFGFLYWTITTDRGLIIFGKVFALLISGKLLCRWGWLFWWLQKWKRGERTVLYTSSFLCTHQKNCLWSLPKHTTGTPTLQLHCLQNVNVSTVQKTGSDLMKGRLWGFMCGCPIPFQNQGLQLILSCQSSCKTPNSFCCHYGPDNQRAKWFAAFSYWDVYIVPNCVLSVSSGRLYCLHMV